MFAVATAQQSAGRDVGHREIPPLRFFPSTAGRSQMDHTLSFQALGEPGTLWVPAREPCDPESMPGSAQAERWIPDSAVCRAGFLRNPAQTGFRNDNWEMAAIPSAIALSRKGEGRSAFSGTPR